MLEKKFLVKGQSLMEWATLLAVVGLAILAMQVYVQRGLQGKTRDLTNAIINSQNLPLRASSATSEEGNTTITSSGTTRVSTLKGGAVNKTIGERTVTKSNTKTVF